MCKICEVELGDCYLVKTEAVDIKVGRRTVGRYEVDVNIERNDDDTFDLSASLFMDDGDTVLVNSIPIKYCPFCGRRLHELKYQHYD